jgi:DNA-binding LytR/AlgR family response regulator
MIHPLRKPYRETGTTKKKLISILVFGLFIFLFLYFFRPFGMSVLKPLQLLFITMGFGLITSFILIIYKFIFEPVVINEKWTLGKNILWDFLIAASIGAANYFYICKIFQLDFTFKYLMFSIWTAILVGSIPVTISYFLAYNRMYREALKKAEVPEEELTWEEEVTVMAGNQKNEIKLNPKNIIYLCSNDNYVTIVTIKDKVQNKTTIRGTLKAAESELRKNNRFIRCHKCYIVNLDFVEKVIGNSQNMKIRLCSSETEIPVARSKAELVSRKAKKKKS